MSNRKPRTTDYSNNFYHTGYDNLLSLNHMNSMTKPKVIAEYMHFELWEPDCYIKIKYDKSNGVFVMDMNRGPNRVDRNMGMAEYGLLQKNLSKIASMVSTKVQTANNNMRLWGVGPEIFTFSMTGEDNGKGTHRYKMQVLPDEKPKSEPTKVIPIQFMITDEGNVIYQNPETGKYVTKSIHAMPIEIRDKLHDVKKYLQEDDADSKYIENLTKGDFTSLG